MQYPSDYQAALDKAIFYTFTGVGMLRLNGPDRRTFVQRQTTNNVNLVLSEYTQTTVLTSPVGRILDVFTLFTEGAGDDESILLQTLPGRTESTFHYLKSRIFIMDKVTISNHSEGYTHYLLAGPSATAILEDLGLGPIPGMNAVRRAFIQEEAVTLIGKPGFSGTACSLTAPNGVSGWLENAFKQAGAVHLSPESFEVLRVEAGIPAAGHELKEDYTPLEVGLASVVAENKGCYTGQEVLARQVSYDKITRQLAGLRLEVSVPPGSEVFTEGRSVGQITSTVVSPRFGPVALAVIKRPFYESGTPLLAGEKGQSVAATVCTLPFQ